MAKQTRFLFLVLFVGLLLLVACTGSTGSEQAADTATITEEDDTLGSGPIPAEEGEEEGPAARGATSTTSDVAGVCLSAEEGELARKINEYRATKNLPPVQPSKSLTLVAQQHVWDSNNNNSSIPAAPAGKSCNMHSWSSVVNPALQQGTWTAVCYTSDHAQKQGMWSKPGEIAGYPNSGYEISHGAVGASVSASSAIDGWKSSSGHNAVIIQQPPSWSTPFLAMGIGLSGGFAHVWFGRTMDPAGEALLCSGGSVLSGGSAASPIPTSTATVVAAQPSGGGTTGGQVLNQTGTITTGGSPVQHTFNVVQGQSYTVLVTPSTGFDVAPTYACSTGQRGNFDVGHATAPETVTITASGNGTCTITVTGYRGSTGTYTIVVTSSTGGSGAPPTATATAAPTVAPTTAAAPAGTILNQTGTVTASATGQHTFNVLKGQTYTMVVTPPSGFDPAPSYACSGPSFRSSATFDREFAGKPDTTSFAATGDGTCTITVAGHQGSTGTYTIVVTSP